MAGSADPTRGRSSDVIECLEADHKEIEHLLFRLDPAGALGSRDVFERLTELLVTHSSSEKEVLYPAVRAALAGGDDVAKDALFDHKDVDLSLERLHKVRLGGDEFKVELLALADKLRRHIRHEEDDIFPALRRELSEDERIKLGERLETARRRAPTRPHPHAPTSALGAKLADRMVSPVDRVRNFIRRRV